MSEIVFNAEMAKAYDEKGPRLLVPGYEAFLQSIATLLDAELSDDASILVMGAGGGAELMALAPVRAGWRFTGVDPSPDMLGGAQAKLTRAGYDARALLHVGYVADAPEGPFDAATSCLLMPFIPDDGSKLDYLRQVHRRLKPGAPLLLVEGFAAREPEAWARYLKLYITHGLLRGAPDAHVKMAAGAQAGLHYVSAERQEALLAEAGFASIERFFQALYIHGWIARA